MFLNLQQVNLPRAYSAGVMTCNVIELMTIRMMSVGMLSLVKSRPDLNTAIAQSVTISS